MGIIGKLLLGSISDKFGVVVSTIWTSVLLVLAYFLAATTTSYGFAILLAILFGLGNSIGTVLPPLIVSAIYPAKSYAQVYGLVNQFLFLGMMFGSLIAASIAEASSYSAAWYVFAVISALIIVFWAGSYFLAKKDFKAIEK